MGVEFDTEDRRFLPAEPAEFSNQPIGEVIGTWQALYLGEWLQQQQDPSTSLAYLRLSNQILNKTLNMMVLSLLLNL